jgi:hypothetical protein
MALTVTKTVLKSFDPEDIVVRCEVAFDSSYPTGGETLDVSDTVGEILWVQVESHGLLGLVIDIDPTGFSTGSCVLMALQGDYAKSADDELTEVDDTTDLSTLGASVRIIVHGRNIG